MEAVKLQDVAADVTTLLGAVTYLRKEMPKASAEQIATALRLNPDMGMSAAAIIEAVEAGDPIGWRSLRNYQPEDDPRVLAFHFLTLSLNQARADAVQTAGFLATAQRDLEAARLRNARLMERVAALEMALASAQQLIASAMAPAGSDAAEFQKGEAEFVQVWPDTCQPYALRDGDRKPLTAWTCGRCTTTWSFQPKWRCLACGEQTGHPNAKPPDGFWTR